MIYRSRILADLDASSDAELRSREDYIEALPPYVLLADADPRHAARLGSVLDHGAALNMHTILLGPAASVPPCRVAADGTVVATDDNSAADGEAEILPPGTRLATLASADLADILDLLRWASFQPNDLGPGDDTEPDPQPADQPTPAAAIADLATPPGDQPAPVRLTVLGEVTLATAGGPITSNVRSDSYALLALLAAHPRGRSLQEIAADLYPGTDPKLALNRVRTAITSLRRVLRNATGQDGGTFILFESDRYRIDPHALDVDLWRFVVAIDRANHADDDPTCLAALREAADHYGGDFAAGQDRVWITDYATTYRHQFLGVLGRIAELTELDAPDQAIAALERALEHDPINEELYQRIMRIHGRRGHLDAVRRTLRLCEDRLSTIGDAEPSEETRRVAARQLHPPAKPSLSGRRR